jgi:hypothetical protein
LRSTADVNQYARVPGCRTLEKIEIAEGTLDLLLTALLLTAAGVFIGANALLANSDVLARSLPIFAVSVGTLSLFCSLSRILRNLPLALAICYGLLLLTVYGPRALTVPGLYVVLAFGFVHTMLRLRLPHRDLMSALGMAAIATAAILGARDAYSSFDMIERLHAGTVRMDTLYHASIAAMIKNYGVTSTGLDGLVYTPYHVLSHELFAAVSVLSRAPVIEVYGVAIWVLFAPLLVFSAAASCFMLAGPTRLDPAKVWYSVCLLLVLASFALGRWAVWDSFFISESYLVSLTMFLLAMPLLFSSALRVGDLAILIAISALICAAKAPVGLVFIELFGIRLILLNRRWKAFEAATLLLMLATAAMVLWSSAVANMTSVWFGPLHFIEKYSFFGPHLAAAHQSLLGAGHAGLRTWTFAVISLCSFIVLHFLMSWAVVGCTAARIGVRAAISSPIVLISLGAVFAGLVIVLLFRIFGGSAYYFSNVAFFASLPSAAALLAEFLSGSRFSTWPILPASTAVVLILSATQYWNASALSSTRAGRAHNVLIERLIHARRFSPREVILKADASALASTPFSYCLARPFVFPAVSERPWIGVMTEDAECHYQDYGFDSYRLPDGSIGDLPPRWPFGGSSAVIQQALP